MGRCTLGRQSHLTPGRNKDKNLRKFNTSDLGMNEETMTRAFHHKVSILNQAIMMEPIRIHGIGFKGIKKKQ